MSDLGALLPPRHRGETGEGGTHARAKRVCLQAIGEERHGGVQAMRDSDGGVAEADEGQHCGEGGCNTLTKHRRQSALSSPHEAGHCIRRGLRQSLHGGS